MAPPFALPPPDFPLPAYVRRVESGLLMPRNAILPGLYLPTGLMGKKEPFNLEYLRSNGAHQSITSPLILSDWNVGGPGLIVLAFAQANTGTLPSITMDGVAMTNAVQSTGNNTRVSLWYGRKASGSTATFVITGTGSSRFSAFAFRISGSLKSNTPYDTAGPPGGSAGTRSVTIDAPKGGAIIIAANGMGEDSRPAQIYTNATLAENIRSGSDTSSVGYYVTPGDTEVDRTISVTNTRCICAASWV